jgi:RNA polymerase sigma factor (sigma-70 family)
VDVTDHIALHNKILRALAFQYGRYDQDLVDDCYQAAVLVLIELHETSYKHDMGTALLTYGWDKVKQRMAREVKRVKGEFRYGITEELDQIQEMAEDVGRDRLRLDELYDDPVPGLRRPLECSASDADLELVRKVRVALSQEELEILSMSYDHSQRHAATALGLSLRTYQRRLDAAREKARKLLPSV